MSKIELVKCTKAKALRMILSDTWVLPDDKKIIDTGKDWVLILLNQLDKAQRAKMLFL
jgi:hypothetical protein